jgi:4'-phosphopantetheinyl transferase
MDVRLLSEAEVFEQMFQKMTKERQKKIKEYRKEADRQRSLAAGILLQKGLSDLGVLEEAANIAYGEHGKPYIKGKPEIRFNLSHAGNYALAGFGEKPLGVDIERIGRVKKGIAKRFFTKKEQEYLEKLSGEEREEGFTKLWTRKESFVKAIGTGLSFGISRVETSVGRQAEIVDMDNHDNNKEETGSSGYFFYEYKIEDYRIAVCSQETECAKALFNVHDLWSAESGINKAESGKK